MPCFGTDSYQYMIMLLCVMLWLIANCKVCDVSESFLPYNITTPCQDTARLDQIDVVALCYHVD